MSEIQDMRQPGESYCANCPDHEACHGGWPCSLVQRLDSEYSAIKVDVEVVAAELRSAEGR